MKSLSAFFKATIVGGALYLVPVVLILLVLGKVHGVTIKLVAPMADSASIARMSAASVSHGCWASSLSLSSALPRVSSPGREWRSSSSAGLSAQSCRTCPATA